MTSSSGDWSVPPQTDELFNHLSTAVVLLNSSGQILHLNPAAERLLSLSLNTGVSKELGQLIDLPKELEQAIQEVGKTARTIKIREAHLNASPDPLMVQVELAPIGSPEKPVAIMVLLEELSMTQALQEENRVRDRLSMIGTLASGLAHEIRNPLGGIRGAAQMLARENKNQEYHEYTSIIISEVDRLNGLVTELLDFSKPKPIKKTTVNVNKILSEMITLQAENLRKSKINLMNLFDPSLPPVLGHGPSLKQAFLNIFKNSVEAMPQGGTLTVGTSFHSNVRILLGEGKAGAMAEIYFKDSGMGIAPENMNSLFTPFFSTKDKGAGLGLMMTQRIVKEHQGSLKVTSKLKKGATFRVFLKLASPATKD